MISNEQWETIGRFVDALDASNGRDPHEILTRIMKVTEENGEAVTAYFGMNGTNPRKGVTHTREDLENELADVILAGAIALATIADRNPADVLNAKLAKIAARAERFPSPRK